MHPLIPGFDPSTNALDEGPDDLSDRWQHMQLTLSFGMVTRGSN
jgi:hypothetical protein